jgi:UDP-N-acetylmuramoyl-tripeptide--D-alanyl-D-alanine ligase
MKKRLLNFLKSVLKTLSKLTLKRFKPTVIAVTGSVGKTSSKEAIWSVLKSYQYARKTSANFNNELGVPLSILGDWEEISKPAWFFWLRVILSALISIINPRKSAYPKVLILEYGADKPGDIPNLLEIARPHVAVVSAIGQIPVHVENYPLGIEAVAREKTKLIFDLSVDDVAVINVDDPIAAKIKDKTRARALGFGFSAKADVKITNFKHLINNGVIEGMTFKLESGNASVPVVLKKAFSLSHAYAAACAACVASAFDINLIGAANAFAVYYKPVKGRSMILEGIKQTQIVDESYNSSPIALEMALKTMKEIRDIRKIAVLGDMMELGDYTAKAHEIIGQLVPECVDYLITVGSRAKFIAQKALKKKMPAQNVFSFEEPKEAGLKLQEIMKKGDLVLIKGSRVIGLDKIVEEVKLQTNN